MFARRLLDAATKPYTGALAAWGLLLFAALTASLLLQKRKISQFPLLGEDRGGYPKRLLAYVNNAEHLYRQGYAQFRDSIYRLTTSDGEHLVVPRKYLDELRVRRDDEITNASVLYTAVETRHTGVPAETPFLNHLVRADLTRNLGRTTGRLWDEVTRTTHNELPQSGNWTSIVLNQKILRLVAIVSGNAFIGPDLCQSEEYVHSSINYAVDVFAAVRVLKKWPKALRPIAQYFVPELNRITEHRAKAQAFLLPVIQERRELMRNGAEMPDDMLQWMLEKAEAHNIDSSSELAFWQLMLSLAAIHTTSMTSVHVLYDILASPEIIQPLREEIVSVLKDNGNIMTTQALFQMKLLDSVMRESQRVHPLSMSRFVRSLEKNITLKDGTKLPAGAIIESPHVALVQDPEIYPNPEKFDPYRFYRLRNGETNDPIGYKSTEQYQFVTVAKEHMAFGFGRNACPGRFFAANQIKMILARMLLDYDFKMPGGRTERFENIVIGGSKIPDPKKEVLLRRVIQT